MKLLIAIFFLMQIAGAGIAFMPFILGGLIDQYGLDSTRAGMLGSAELGGLAFASIALARVVSQGGRRKCVLTGAGIAMLGHGLSGIDLGYEILMGSRVLAGLGEGAMSASAMATAAGVDNPERLFAKLGILQSLFFALLTPAAPFLVEAYGPAGLFSALGVMTLIVVPLTTWIPNAPGPATFQTTTAEPSRQRALALMSIAALMILATGQVMIWVFSERLGVLAGLNAESIGLVLGVNWIVGIVGAGAAAWAGTRYGSVLPMVIGLSVYLGCTVAMIHLNQPTMYVGSNIGIGVSFAFFVPYMMGALAALDRTGRWTATAAGVQAIGVAIGPALGGLLLGLGWDAVSLMMIVSTPVGFVLLMPALRRTTQRAVASPGLPGEA